ncbi:MAG: tetratricopeptide repeat protein [Saprospiraceae bacterium]|nr:tetratricopeptide repeat protein [Saprospiraceae bacterium]
MKFKKIMFLLAMTCISAVSFAQKTTVFTEANLAYKAGEEFYDKGLYSAAIKEYKKAMVLLLPANEPDSKMLRTRAELGYAKGAVRLDWPDGEKLILDFIRKYQPDPIANQALIEVANYFYNAKKYDKAIEFFSQIPSWELTEEQRSEVRFKMGYSFFVKQKFGEAKNNFTEVKAIENEYYYPTNYYFGLCEFFLGNYEQAVQSFRLVERSKKYKAHVPYYITQIYFAEGDFDQVVAYGEPKLKDPQVRRKKEINQLVGQSYFEQGSYTEALPFLEEYAERSGKLKAEEFYQIGYTQYSVGQYDKAIKNLQQLESEDSEMVQYALFYLGDAYLKTGNKSAARNAFGKASRMDFDANIKEDALFNFAKLSYELKYDRDALVSLQKFKPGSKYYMEAQELLSDIFLNTRDYARALKILEDMPNKTPQLREAYQQVAYYRGQQLYKEGKFDEAKRHFQKSLDTPIDKKFKALATYWMGDIAHDKKQFDESKRQLGQFLTLAKSIKDLPDESSVFTANYLQGYNYLKQKNYNSALGYFQDAVAGIKRNSMFIRNRMIKEDVLGDATLRAGDCLFKRNKYSEAVKFYNAAINGGYAGFEYAIFQKALIEGLRKRTTEKIIALENLVDNHPNSDYADDALFQLGITYQDINQYNKAIKPLKDLVANYRGSNLVNPSLLRLGLITYNQGSMQTAVNYYKQIFANNPSAGEANAALTALEEIYIDDLGDPDGYASFLETVPGYKMDNYSRDTLNFKAAESAFENGNYNRAIDGFTDYIRKFPNGRNLLVAYYHRGESYTVLKNYTKALADYDWVVRKGQSRYYVKALEKAAIIAYHNEQNFEKAYEYYSKLETEATTADMRFEAQLGGLRSAYRTNNTSAVAKLARKVAQNPSANQEQISTANFYLGKVAFDEKDYNTALSALRKVVKQSDNEQTAEARYLIAYIQYTQRNLETAKEMCINANKESSSFPYWVAKSVILLSDIFAEQNDLFNAKAALEALIENYDGDQELINIAKAKLQRLEQQSAASSRLDRGTDDGKFLIEDDGGN